MAPSSPAGALAGGTPTIPARPTADVAAPPLARWTSLSAATRQSSTEWDPHTCGVKTDGGLYCWGDGDANLGDGPIERLTLAPMQIATDQTWSKVSSSTHYSCAIDTDAELWCWGSNSRGQLGDGTKIERDELRTVNGPSSWAEVSATYLFVCGVTTDGRLWCWGAGSAGQLGLGGRRDKHEPAQVGADTDWATVATGSGQLGPNPANHGHTCAVKSSGTLWCWGDNDRGQLGLGDTRRKTKPTQVGADSDWATVAVDSHASCAIKTDGSLWCWGDNEHGRLGDGTETDHSTPNRVGAAAWSSVTVGPKHACAIQTDASAWCWGENDGRLGDGTTVDHLVPTKVIGGYSWSALSATLETTCGLTTDAVGMCWGGGGHGQRGTGQLEDSLAPDIRDPVWDASRPWRAQWASMGGGERWSCGVTDRHRLACWNDAMGDYPRPFLKPTWKWRAAEVGDTLMCAVRMNGKLFCYDRTGSDPTLVKLAAGAWTTVEVGSAHACALQDDASLWCWGDNGSGQLGTGDTTDRAEPVQVPGSWASVGPGGAHTCAIKTDGSLWCWGSNSAGQLGLGYEGAPVLSPMHVGARTDWQQVSPGGGWTCGVTADHAGWCWGWNEWGQLGDGTRDGRSTPTPVTGPSNWASLTGALLGTTCGLRLDGSAWCWGENYGALGDGTEVHSDVPVAVVGGHTFTSLDMHWVGGCGIDLDGLAWCWGHFAGDGTDDVYLSPTALLSVRGL